MVQSSTLRQGRYLPLHGSFWNTVLCGRIFKRNPFNGIEPHAHAIQLDATDKQKISSTSKGDRPTARWSCGKLSRWMSSKIQDSEDTAIWSIRKCIQCFNAVPMLSVDKNGLYPIFAHDIFGVRGVAGLSQWVIDSGATSSCTNDLYRRLV